MRDGDRVVLKSNGNIGLVTSIENDDFCMVLFDGEGMPMGVETKSLEKVVKEDGTV